MANSKNRKQYLGDSVYADWSGDAVILTTENGVPFDPSNKIVLEPEVLEALFKFAKAEVKFVT